MARSVRMRSGQGGASFRGPAGALAPATQEQDGPAAADTPRLPDLSQKWNSASIQSASLLAAGGHLPRGLSVRQREGWRRRGDGGAILRLFGNIL